MLSCEVCYCIYAGKVHFWNVYEGSSPMGAFKAVSVFICKLCMFAYQSLAYVCGESKEYSCLDYNNTTLHQNDLK